MPYTAQEVAAAILYLHGGEMQYERLTRQILETKLSGLGKRGGITPERTMNTELNKRYGDDDIFTSRHKGWYELKEPEKIKNYPSIICAVEEVRERRLLARIQSIQQMLGNIPKDKAPRYNLYAHNKYNDQLEKTVHEIFAAIKEGMGERLTYEDKKAFKHRHTKN